MHEQKNELRLDMVKLAVVTKAMSTPSGFNNDRHVLPRLTFVQLEQGGASNIKVPGPGIQLVHTVEDMKLLYSPAAMIA